MANRNLVRHQGNVREQLNAAVPMGLVRDDKLSVMTKAVALEVWSHTEGRHQSASSVAEALGINRKTVYPALTELEARGWLVREVHHKTSEKGNQVWEREVWHLQMTNTPFTEEETLSLKRTGVCPPDGQVPVHETDTIEVKGRSAPEVHSDHRSTREPVRQTDRSGGDDQPRESEHSPKFGSCSEPGDSEPDPFSSDSSSSRGDAQRRIADPFDSLATSASSSQGESWGNSTGEHESVPRPESWAPPVAPPDSGDPSDPFSEAFVGPAA